MGAINRFPAGGGSKINGIIEEYKVAAGENVSAGDFVSYVQRYVGETEVTKTYLAKAGAAVWGINCVELDEQRVLMVYGTYSPAELRGDIITFGDNSITTYTSNVLSSSMVYKSPAIAKLSDNKYIVAYDSASTLRLAILDIDGDVITTTETMTGGSYSRRDGGDIVVLDNNMVAIFSGGGTQSTQNPIVMFGIVEGSEYTHKTTINVAGNGGGWVGGVALSNNLLLSTYVSVGYVYATIVTVNVGFGGEVTASAIASWNTSNSIPSGRRLLKLSDTKAALLGVNSTDKTKIVVYFLNVENNAIEQLNFVNIPTGYTMLGYNNAAILVDDKIFMCVADNNNYVHLIVMEVGETSATIVSDTIVDNVDKILAGDEGRNSVCLTERSDGSLFIGDATQTNILNAYLTNAIIEPTVATYDTSREICGVAKGSGAAGEVIEVTVPEVMA